MQTEEIKKMIERLQSQLQNEMKNYDKALDENAGFTERRDIRTKMRELGEEIILLKRELKDTDQT